MQRDLRDGPRKNGPAAYRLLYGNEPHPVSRPQHRRHPQRPLRPPIHGLHSHDRRDPALRRRLRRRHDLPDNTILDRHTAACVPELISFLPTKCFFLPKQ